MAVQEHLLHLGPVEELQCLLDQAAEDGLEHWLDLAADGLKYHPSLQDPASCLRRRQLPLVHA